MRRRKPTHVVFRVTHPQAGEGYAYTDDRSAYRLLHNRQEPISYDDAKRYINGAWRDLDYVKEQAAKGNHSHDAFDVLTVDEWRKTL